MCAHSHKCPVTGLDSSGVARCAVSSGDSCGGRRQVGTASHVHRGRSFVWLHASVCVVRDSAWMPASECAQSIKRTRSFAAIPGSYGLEPVYDRSGELLDRYAAELIGAPAVPRALPHARAHSRRTTARASRPIPAMVAIRCGRTARALREGRRRPPGQTREDRSGLQARARRRERRLAGPATDR